MLNNTLDTFFNASLEKVDSDIYRYINCELRRQREEIELIASENIVSKAVLEAQSSVLTNKYAEGYPKKRYYGGCEFVDEVELLAIERAKELFGCSFANVQPHSGSQANQSVFMSLMKPGDTYMGLDLSSGGHLTHGSAVNLSGMWFNAVPYGVDRKTHLINLNQVEELAQKYSPKIIIVGGSSYSRHFDFKAFKEICDRVGAFLVVDMAHFAGLVAGKAHPSPFPYADIVTSTTHKTLRGPRGGLVLTNNEALIKKINSSIFPGLQGGPLMHIIAAKAVCFKEALSSNFKEYAKQVVINASVLSKSFQKNGFQIVSGGTDNHLILLDLQKQGLTGKRAEEMLSKVNITCNKNAIPFDPEKPFVTSGIRLGSPAVTTRGFKEKEMEQIAGIIGTILSPDFTFDKENDILNTVKTLLGRFPIYS